MVVVILEIDIKETIELYLEGNGELVKYGDGGDLLRFLVFIQFASISRSLGVFCSMFYVLVVIIKF